MALHKFDDLVGAIAQAFVHAREIVEEQHLRTFRRFFDERPAAAPEGGSPVLVAKKFRMVVPDLDDDGEKEFELEVPSIALVPWNSLVIDGIELEFTARLSDLSADDDESEGTLRMELMGSSDRADSKANVTVKISMKGADPPEGLVRINDSIVKHLP